ncbi:MAG: PASTA domain-containing protein [Gaiellaceae bacterium]
MLLPRLAALVVIWLLAAASLTFAAGSKQIAQSPTQGGKAKEKPTVLVVPDVRRQAYVFAKGILQDAGFAWRVDGSVKGYAANTVAVQTPAPGTRLVDNGSPTVVLRLERSGEYPERGLPENASFYKGTPAVLLSDWRRANRAAAQAEPAAPAATETAPSSAPAPTTTAATPAEPPPTETAEAPPAPAAEAEYRTPDFVVEDAPREPADELPLPERARLLEQRVAAAPKSTRKLVNHWLYQHSWIVTGARFGWRKGDDALRILIRVDRSLDRRFGFGARSEAVARRALAEVLRQSG